MKRPMVRLALACLLVPAWGAAQDANLKLPDFRGLAGKATESVNISLGPWALRMAGAFVDDKDAGRCGDQASSRRHQIDPDSQLPVRHRFCLLRRRH